MMEEMKGYKIYLKDILNAMKSIEDFVERIPQAKPHLEKLLEGRD